jgi:DNA topoisomerase-3
MRLVVAEKPSVARDLARVLGASRRGEGCLEGDGLRITWCVGHLVELEDPEHYDPAWKRWSLDTLPMLPEAFVLRPRKEGRDQWKIVRALLRDRAVTEVVNACDAGREGELIFRLCYELAGCKARVLRLWVSSLTPEAIRDAWADLRPGARYDALGDAARCRSEADWLVGLNATRALTCRAREGGGGVVLSVGRVQTPTLAMIVGRDQEIAAFVPEVYWRVEADLAVAEPAARWTAVWVRSVEPPDERPDDDKDAPHVERIPDEATARAIAAAAAGRPAELRDSDRKTRREPPPLLYDLTSLQRRANVRYGFTAERTLALAQALYETHKLITYPRTDARYITPDQVPLLPDVVRGLERVPVYAPFAQAVLARGISPGRRVVDASEVGDHHAILPTGRTPDGASLGPDEKRLFDLVARRLLAVLSPDAVLESAVLVAAVDPGTAPLPEGVARPLLFRASGRVVREVGWRAVDPPGKSKELELPALQAGARGVVVAARPLEGKTRPPPPYNDATLLRAMETAGKDLDEAELARAMRRSGLGTPATRASILETLVRRQFVVREERALRATERGVAVIEALAVPELKSAELTGRWEARLHDVADGRLSRVAFMADIRGYTREVVGRIAGGAAPPQRAVAAPEEAPIGVCPRCGAPVRAKRSVFVCDGGTTCGLVIFRVVAGRPVSDRMVKELLTKGHTKPVKGFKSKAGKPFEAALTIRDDGRVGLRFERDHDGAPSAPSASDPPAAPAGAREPAKPRARAAAVEAPAPVSPVGMPCPACGAGRILEGRAAWGCDRWRDGCALRLPFERAGRRLSGAEAVALLRVAPAAR